MGSQFSFETFKFGLFIFTGYVMKFEKKFDKLLLEKALLRKNYLYYKIFLAFTEQTLFFFDEIKKNEVI